MKRKKKPKPIGQQIAEARQALGITQAELGERAGLAQPNISAIERGEYKPRSMSVLTRLATALGKSLYWDGTPRLVDPADIEIRES